MELILKYLKQPSTYVGIATVLAAFGCQLTDGFVQSLGILVIAIIGMIEVIRNEGIVDKKREEENK